MVRYSSPPFGSCHIRSHSKSCPNIDWKIRWLLQVFLARERKPSLPPFSFGKPPTSRNNRSFPYAPETMLAFTTRFVFLPSPVRVGIINTQRRGGNGLFAEKPTTVRIAHGFSLAYIEDSLIRVSRRAVSGPHSPSTEQYFLKASPAKCTPFSHSPPHQAKKPRLQRVQQRAVSTWMRLPDRKLVPKHWRVSKSVYCALHQNPFSLLKTKVDCISSESHKD